MSTKKTNAAAVAPTSSFDEIFETPDVDSSNNNDLLLHEKAKDFSTHPSSNKTMDDVDVPNPVAAFERFSGKTFFPQSSLNFDHESRFEFSNDPSPIVRFTKLKSELAKLEKDLSILAKGQVNGTVMVNANANVEFEEMSLGLAQLSSQLTGMSSSPYLAVSPGVLAAPLLDTQNEVSSKLFRDIAAFQKTLRENQTINTKGAKGDDKAALTYELYSTGTCNNLIKGDNSSDSSQRLAELEERIFTLEKLLGSAEQMRLEGNAPLNVLTAIESLEARMNLLSEKTLDGISSRMTSMMTTCQHVQVNSQQQIPQGNRSSNTVEDSLTDQKLNQLYKQMESLGAIQAAVPVLVDRLVSLQGLHHETSSFHQRLEEVEESQTTTQALLSQDAILLEQMKISLGENVAIFKQNLTELTNNQ